MTIVRLNSNEANRLRAIRLRSLQDAPDAFGSTFADAESRPMESWTQQLEDMATFVAVQHKDDVGIVRGDRDHHDRDTVWLISMWVAPDARGQGISDALIGALVTWAEEERFRRVLLDVGNHNQHAIKLYERMGFCPNGITNTLPPPRQHISEHQLELWLDRSEESLNL